MLNKVQYNWEEIKWILIPDGSLRNIHIDNTTINDWKLLIDFLDKGFVELFGKQHQINIENIDRNYIDYYLLNLENLDAETIHIRIDQVLINCHPYNETEIEFDISTKEIKSNIEFDLILKFMNIMRLKFQKPIRLTDVGEEDENLIIIHSNGKSELLSKDRNMKEFKFNQ
ncbi:MAG: hypothetical protein BM557_07610 [Flavobacterium sp. MedPE-SWcel]|uniref:hypothetical protein n=1 Tax=uncultured Flavobacterium sp. TaxID=165435 RepID=UPI000921C2B9|nr:hypothetical protein [uncultured Flavobacterium sp.]OIQ18074.1 MAG: hypothetical protein BM557_07610 [Flavobacterium sp. MedPE-SWcel]